MFSEGGGIMVFGVLLSCALIVGFVWYVNNKIPALLTEKDWLTRFVALLLTALLGLFIVDKLVAFKIPLLTEEMSNGLFDLIKNIVLVVFGYQFNAKDNRMWEKDIEEKHRVIDRLEKINDDLREEQKNPKS
jgi:uncharacterized protein YacL